MNAIRLYFRLVRVSLRTQMAYRASFSVQMLANIATTLADFFAVFAFLPTLRGAGALVFCAGSGVLWHGERLPGPFGIVVARL